MQPFSIRPSLTICILAGTLLATPAALAFRGQEDMRPARLGHSEPARGKPHGPDKHKGHWGHHHPGKPPVVTTPPPQAPPEVPELDATHAALAGALLLGAAMLLAPRGRKASRALVKTS